MNENLTYLMLLLLNPIRVKFFLPNTLTMFYIEKLLLELPFLMLSQGLRMALMMEVMLQGENKRLGDKHQKRTSESHQKQVLLDLTL